jgi:RimJ/RimL family protein N-acetyltransferase
LPISASTKANAGASRFVRVGMRRRRHACRGAAGGRRSAFYRTIDEILAGCAAAFIAFAEGVIVSSSSLHPSPAPQQPHDEFGQPIGAAVTGWTSRAQPARTAIAGRYCRVEAVDLRHAEDLYEAYRSAPDGRDWTYMSVGPFASLAAYREQMTRMMASADPLHYAIIDLASGKAVGTLALMRIDPANGVIEIGFVAYSPKVQRTPMGTEAQYLLMRHAFDDLGYRRYEWKCDHLNAPSRRAALRYGFQFEGIFRQAVIYKGRSRDTAWFAIIDSEWPRIKHGFEQWLAPANFDTAGQQRATLGSLIGGARA